MAKKKAEIQTSNQKSILDEEREEHEGLLREQAQSGSGELTSSLSRVGRMEDFLSSGSSSVEGIKRRAAIMRSAKKK